MRRDVTVKMYEKEIEKAADEVIAGAFVKSQIVTDVVLAEIMKRVKVKAEAIIRRYEMREKGKEVSGNSDK